MNYNTRRIRGQLINNCYSLLKLEKEDKGEKRQKSGRRKGEIKNKKREIKNYNSVRGGIKHGLDRLGAWAG